jgi:hypothetical protein
MISPRSQLSFGFMLIGCYRAPFYRPRQPPAKTSRFNYSHLLFLRPSSLQNAHSLSPNLHFCVRRKAFLLTANLCSMMVAVNPDKQAAVLRVAAYHRRDFDRIGVNSDPRKQSMVQPFISEPFASPSSAPLGTLRHLPSEVLVEICSYLDILSSFRLRQVNRMARQVVSGTPAYRDLSTHALDSLRTALRTRIAGWILVSDLYRILCTTECSQCGLFGPLLFLPTVERCCYHCLDSSPNYRVVSLSALSKVSGVSQSQLRRLVPVISTLPGKYDILGNQYKKRLNLVAERTALQSTVLQTKSPDIQHLLTIIPEPRGRSGSIAPRCMMVTAFPSMDKASSNVQDGVSCKGCQVALETGNRDISDYELRDRSYSKEGFLVHFQSCEEAHKLWQASDGGTTSVIEPVSTRSGRSISQSRAEQYYK